MRTKIACPTGRFSPWLSAALIIAGSHRAPYLAAGSSSMPPLSRTRPLVIAISPKSLDNPVFVDAKETAELEARRLNVVLEWVAPFKVDPAVQERIIEGLIRRKVDGIAVSCSDVERMRRMINKAAAAGIKVATIDADIPDSKRLFYCGTNNYKAGYACGEAMVRLVRERGLADKPLRTAILTGASRRST